MALETIHRNSKEIVIKTEKLTKVIFIIFFHSCVRYDLCDSIHNFTNNFQIEFVYIIYFILMIVSIKTSTNNKICLIPIHTFSFTTIINLFILILIFINNNSTYYQII